MKNYLYIALALILFLVVGYIVIVFGAKAYVLISNASDNVKAASIAAFMSVLTLVIGRFYEQKKELRQRLNSEKIQVYLLFFEMYFNLFSGQKPGGKKAKDNDLVQELLEFQKLLIFWGSDSVLKSYIEFRKALIKFGESQDENSVKLAPVLQSTTNLLVAMRKDIGYSFTTFSVQDLVVLQLSQNDPDNQKLLENL